MSSPGPYTAGGDTEGGKSAPVPGRYSDSLTSTISDMDIGTDSNYRQFLTAGRKEISGENKIFDLQFFTAFNLIW